MEQLDSEQRRRKANMDYEKIASELSKFDVEEIRTYFRR